MQKNVTKIFVYKNVYHLVFLIILSFYNIVGRLMVDNHIFVGYKIPHFKTHFKPHLVLGRSCSKTILLIFNQQDSRVTKLGDRTLE